MSVSFCFKLYVMLMIEPVVRLFNHAIAVSLRRFVPFKVFQRVTFQILANDQLQSAPER